MNAAAIRNKLESVYRCTIGVRASPSTNGKAAALHVSLSHMPHALEGLNRTEFGIAIMTTAREEINLALGEEIIFSFSVSAIRDASAIAQFSSLFQEAKR